MGKSKKYQSKIILPEDFDYIDNYPAKKTKKSKAKPKVKVKGRGKLEL